MGPFDLLQPVARGATACVWRGSHRGSGKAVAIKILTHPRWRTQQSGGAFDRELQTVALLDHPAVIRVHDYGWIDAETAAASADQLVAGCPYLVMDWLDGGSLVTAPRGLDFAHLRQLLLRILDGLAYIHARGFIHRDIKPANVLMSATGPVLSDLGAAYSLTGDVYSEAEEGICGTPNYLAPEQFTVQPWLYGPWTDLYALGCLAWKLATGRAPFRRPDVRETMAARLRDPLPAFEALAPVPAGFEPWLRRLLAREPTDRFRFAIDAARTLFEVGPPQDVPGSLMTWWTELRRGASMDDLTVVDTATYSRSGIDEPTKLVALAGLEPDIDEPGEAGCEPVGPSATIRPESIDWRQGEQPPHVLLTDCGHTLALLRMPVMCGRETIRQALWGELQHVAAKGAARLVVVDGPSGIGKTRLVEWLTHRAHEVGLADNVWARAREAKTRGSGLWSMLTRRVPSHPTTPTESIVHLCAALGVSPNNAAAIAAYGHQRLSSAGVVGERETFLAIQAALAKLCARRALIVVVDDAQLDDTALRFVQRALARLADLPLLFVLSTNRSADDVDPRIVRRLETLTQGASLPPIVLRTLDGSTTSDVLDRWLALEPGIRQMLCKVVRGNPLHAMVILQHWLESGALVDSPLGYRAVEDRALPFPETITEAWQYRLDHVLDGESSDIDCVLELAAVLGSPIVLPTWSAVTAAADLPGPERWLTRLHNTDILRMGDADEFELSHPVLAKALIERARSRGRLARWHGLCADTLASMQTVADSRYAERIADHLDAAGRHREAVSRWLEACATSRITGELDRYHRAILKAARSFRRLRRPRTDHRWIRIKQDWAGRSTHLRSIEHALRHVRQALALARRGGHINAVAEILRSQARRLLVMGQLDSAQRLLHEARDICSELDDPALLARVLQTAARLKLQQGLHHASWELAASSARLAASIDDPHTLAIAVNIQGELARRRGDFEAAAEAYREVARVAQSAEYVVIAHCNLALVHIELGQVDAAEASAESSLWEAERLALPFSIVAANVVLLVCAAEKGDPQAWERAWLTLDDVRDLKILEYDIARYLEKAARVAAGAWSARAFAAATLAARLFAKLGHHAEDAAVRTWMAKTFAGGAARRSMLTPPIPDGRP